MRLTIGGRMAMRLSNFLAALSLLVCVAAAGLWVRSYFVCDRAFACGAVAGNAQRVIDVSSALGRVWFEVERTQGFSLGTSPREGARVYSEDVRLARPPSTRWGLGFGGRTATLTYDHTAPIPPKVTTWTLTFSHGWLMAVAAVLPAGWLVARRRRAAGGAAGVCPQCGYDLRGNPSASRCPECGTPFSASTPRDK